MNVTRHLKWSQSDIFKWARATFGWHSQLAIGIRGNKEMSELLSMMQNKDTDVNAIAEECADVCIFLMQICESCNRDLLGMVDHKMDINEKRTWKLSDDGSHQHVD